MSHSQEHAILEWLRDFRATWHPAGTEPSRMRAETVRFVKHRDAPDGELWYVTCDADGSSRGTERWELDRGSLQRQRGQVERSGVTGGGGNGDRVRRSRP